MSGRRSQPTQGSFVEIDDDSREKMVADIAQEKVHTALVDQSKFFQRFRLPVVGAYYTTPEAFKDIGYPDNVLLESYPPMTDEERTILETNGTRL